MGDQSVQRMCRSAVIVVFLALTLAAVEGTGGEEERGVLAENDSGSSVSSGGDLELGVCQADSPCDLDHATVDSDDDKATLHDDDKEQDGWDSRGYITFSPTMGNFGNQIELYLGAFAFAKALNRTLIVPPFGRVTYRNRKVQNAVPFAELFQLGLLKSFLSAVTMEDFLERLAPDHWPADRWKSYGSKFATLTCAETRDSLYWSSLSTPVSFAECYEHQLPTNADMEKEKSFEGLRKAWNDRFPLDEHPVLALHHTPSKFPVLAGNRQLQKYLHWTEEIFAPARAYIERTFGEERWVAVHLRNGDDWVRACELNLSELPSLMGSPQCHEEKKGAFTKEMCLPSLSHVLNLTLQVFKDVQARHLFIATDQHSYLSAFTQQLAPLGVSVHHLDPDMPQMDLMVLGQADYFIGSCASTFTSFVKRERDVNGKPSIFWGLDYQGFH